MVVINKVEFDFTPGSVEQIIQSAVGDSRFSHLQGKQLLVLQNGKAVAEKKRASTMISDGDVLSVMEIYFGG